MIAKCTFNLFRDDEEVPVDSLFDYNFFVDDDRGCKQLFFSIAIVLVWGDVR